MRTIDRFDWHYCPEIDPYEPKENVEKFTRMLTDDEVKKADERIKKRKTVGTFKKREFEDCDMLVDPVQCGDG